MSKLPDISFTDHADERMDDLSPEDRLMIAEMLENVHRYPNHYLERLMLYEGDKYKYYNLYRFDADDFVVIVSYDDRTDRVIKVVEILKEDQVITKLL